MMLSGRKIYDLFISLLYDEKDIVDGKLTEEAESRAIKVKGVTKSIAFDGAKVNENKDTIHQMLEQLPESFSKDQGDTFLNSVMDKHNNIYGEQYHAEELLLMGEAIDQILLSDINTWKFLPGSCPMVKYFPNGYTEADKEGFFKETTMIAAAMSMLMEEEGNSDK